MAYTEILCDVRDRVATITLNRPDKLNAWTRTMDAEVRAAIAAAAADAEVRVIVVTVAQAVDVADARMVESFGSEDFREGVAHFIEKRAPAFSGR